MSEVHLHPVMPEIEANAHIKAQDYREMYQESVVNPEGFWREHGKVLDWMTPYTK